MDKKPAPLTKLDSTSNGPLDVKDMMEMANMVSTLWLHLTFVIVIRRFITLL